MTGTVDPSDFRHVLGHYPTGVCVVTGLDAVGTPLGMTVGSFGSVSLDPPLVAFMPGRQSTTWPRIAKSGRFCINVLADDQQDVCHQFATRLEDRFGAVAHRPSRTGLPILEGAVAWIECELYAVHEAGDHFIVLGRVDAYGVERASDPLLFLRGGFRSFAPVSATTVRAGDAH